MSPLVSSEITNCLLLFNFLHTYSSFGLSKLNPYLRKATDSYVSLVISEFFAAMILSHMTTFCMACQSTRSESTVRNLTFSLFFLFCRKFLTRKDVRGDLIASVLTPCYSLRLSTARTPGRCLFASCLLSTPWTAISQDTLMPPL